MSDLFNNTFSADGISVYYGSTCAVDNVSFDLMPGQLNAVIGNNGCGKTSLIKAIMGLIKHNGKCQLNEHLLENLSVKCKLICYTFNIIKTFYLCTVILVSVWKIITFHYRIVCCYRIVIINKP